MIRALSILAAVAALAVSAAPALAATSKKPPHGTARVGGKMHLEDTQLHTFSGDAYVNEMG